MTDEALAALSVDSMDALEELISRYSRLVRACARPLFLVGADREDLVQEGMIGLLYAIRSYTPESGTPFEAYAVVCVRNKLYSAVRAASASKHTPLNDSVSFHTFSFDDTVPESMRTDPEADLINREVCSEFMDALQTKLSVSEKKVFSLFLQGLSYQEIGQRWGKPVKAVDNAVQRIRRKAAAILGDNGSAV